jgi:hypothetical protein
MIESATREYQRLCSLLGGKPPYGDCQLVALMINRAIPDSQIVDGIVRVSYDNEDTEQCWRDIEHFWVIVNGTDIDPLAQDWSHPTILSRSIVRIVEPSEILDDYIKFIAKFPDPIIIEDFPPLFPLRWQLKNELI